MSIQEIKQAMFIHEIKKAMLTEDILQLTLLLREQSVEFLNTRHDELLTHTLLTYAIESHNVDAANVLINLGVDVNAVVYDNMSPLLLACQEKQLELVNLLLSSGADSFARDVYEFTPMFWSIWPDGSGDEIVKVLVKHGVELNNCNHKGWSAIQLAEEVGNMNVVEILKEATNISTT